MRKHVIRLTKSIQRLCRGRGLAVGRYLWWADPVARRIRLFSEHQVDTVLDIGANTGQYGRSLRRLGYKGRIVSFEPLSSAYTALVAEAAHDPTWTTYPLGIGDAAGEFEIHIAGNSQSSSLLPMANLHEAAAPDSRYVSSETIKVETLDSFIQAHPDQLGQQTFVKIDAQGYESRILDGGKSVVAGAVGVQLERSLALLYEGETLMPEMLARMDGLGFTLMDLETGFVDKRTGRLLQVDGVWFRE